VIPVENVLVVLSNK
jgi:hypothetical protein